MKKIVMYEPSIGSDNLGDQIIVESIKCALNDYLHDSLHILLQIAIAMSIVIVFARWVQNRFFAKIALLIRQHKEYKICTSAVMALVIRCAKVFSSLQRRIAYMANIETFKALYHAGAFLKSAHRNHFQCHIFWVLFGVLTCIIMGIFKGIMH